MECRRAHDRHFSAEGNTKSSVFCLASMKMPSAKSMFRRERSMRRRFSRRNRSLRGGKSPLFDASTVGKKKGVWEYEASEPSSPKVTCIGKVRVKTKIHRKRKKRMASRSNSSRNQRWVHLPFTVCEAFKSFGSGLRCLFPCRKWSICNYKIEQRRNSVDLKSEHENIIVSNWLMDLEENTDVEKVKNVDVFDVIDDPGEEKEREEECDTVCVPPANALLLMRSKSEPCVNRFLDSPDSKEERSMEKNGEEEKGSSTEFDEQEEEEEEERIRNWVSTLVIETIEKTDSAGELNEERGSSSGDIIEKLKNNTELDEESNVEEEARFEETMKQSEERETEIQEENQLKQEENGEWVEREDSPKSFEKQKQGGGEEEGFEESNKQLIEQTDQTEEQTTIHVVNPLKTEESETCVVKEKPLESFEEGEESELPECLVLMMMYEPKLSMEVSKETWVCRTDFHRQNPGRVSLDYKPNRKTQEEKVVPAGTGTIRREPIILTRCKSEPMRTSTKLASEACFCKSIQIRRRNFNRLTSRLEPSR